MMKKIDIPIKVVSELNIREHWTQSYKRHKEQKFIVKQFLKQNDVPQIIPVKITMIRIGVRKLDSDNLQGAFKYVRDAISDYFIPGLPAGRADDNSGFYWFYDQKAGQPSIQVLLDWDLHENPWLSAHQECLP